MSRHKVEAFRFNKPLRTRPTRRQSSSGEDVSTSSKLERIENFQFWEFQEILGDGILTCSMRLQIPRLLSSRVLRSLAKILKITLDEVSSARMFASEEVRRRLLPYLSLERRSRSRNLMTMNTRVLLSSSVEKPAEAVDRQLSQDHNNF